MLRLFNCFILVILLSSCINPQGQKEPEYKLVSGQCEGCEAIFEYGNKTLFPVDTLPDFKHEGPKLKISGTIYHPDGKSPAMEVILYIYHTDQDGNYTTKGDETGWARLHGYLRGSIKTGIDGKYTFYTIKPGIYPSGNAPAHVHATILEPNVKYYWI
jgi:protocatechuate 3,4-dioxygenase beta subunit